MSQIRFTKEHGWARIEGDVAVCGVTTHAQQSLGDIVYVELPEVGKKISRGSQVAVVESAKSTNEIPAPLDGEIVAVNEELSGDPGKINVEALGGGWIFKLKPADPAQLDALMDENAYQKYIGEV